MSPYSSKLSSRMAFSPQSLYFTLDSTPHWNLASFGFCKKLSRVSPPDPLDILLCFLFSFCSLDIDIPRVHSRLLSFSATHFHSVSFFCLVSSSNSLLINPKSTFITSYLQKYICLYLTVWRTSHKMFADISNSADSWTDLWCFLLLPFLPVKTALSIS